MKENVVVVVMVARTRKNSTACMTVWGNTKETDRCKNLGEMKG
jgi:hypothetical protein